MLHYKGTPFASQSQRFSRDNKQNNSPTKFSSCGLHFQKTLQRRIFFLNQFIVRDCSGSEINYGFGCWGVGIDLVLGNLLAIKSVLMVQHLTQVPVQAKG